MPNQRVLRGVPATLITTLYDQNGAPAAPTGTVTVTVTRANGTPVLSGVPATVAAELVSVDLSVADTTALDVLSTQWTDDATGAVFDTTHDIVGGYYFTVAEARGSGPGLSDPTNFSDAEIVAARRFIEEECETITGRSFVPRYQRIVTSGAGNSELWLPHPDIRKVRGATVDGLVFAAPVISNIAVVASRLTMPDGYFGFGFGNVVLEYEYGLDTPPMRIRDAALLRLRSVLDFKRTGVTSRAEYEFVDGRAFANPAPGVRGSRTGIREVDEAYAAYTYQRGNVFGVPVR